MLRTPARRSQVSSVLVRVSDVDNVKTTIISFLFQVSERETVIGANEANQIVDVVNIRVTLT